MDKHMTMGAAQAEIKPGAAMQTLEPLAGYWTFTSPQWPGSMGRTTFEWIEDGAYLLQHSSIPSAPSSAWVIGFDDGTQRFHMLYTDSRAIARVYQMTFDGRTWTIWRDAIAPDFSQRFTGELSEDGRTIDARWETSKDGKHWLKDFDLTYTKQMR